MVQRISQTIFGCAPLGVFDMGELELSETMLSAEKAFECGITTFDCADIYGLGAAEENLALALGSKIQSAHIISKFGVCWEPDTSGRRLKTYRDCSSKHMEKALNASLRRLGREQIDTYFVHWPDGKTSLSEIADAMERAKKAGKIGEYGFSNFPASEIVLAVERGDAAPAWVQVECNLLSTDKELEDLRLLRKYDVGVMAYGTLAQGYLTGKFKQIPVFGKNDRRARMPHFQAENFLENQEFIFRLKSVSDELGLSMGQTATAWCLESGLADAVIIGIKTVPQLLDIVKNLDNQLLGSKIIKLNEARLHLKTSCPKPATLHQ